MLHILLSGNIYVGYQISFSIGRHPLHALHVKLTLLGLHVSYILLTCSLFMLVFLHSCFMWKCGNEIGAKYSLKRQTGNLGRCTQMVLTLTNLFEKIGY